MHAGSTQIDPAPLDELYRTHVNAAWALAQAVTGNRDDAADAVAEAFSRLARTLPEVQPSNFRPYLMAATRNAAIDIVRRSARVWITDDLRPVERPDDSHRPDEALLAGEDASLTRQAFDELPERWRSVLWLVDVERLPARDVATILGTSANNVAQLAVRARARMRDHYVQAHVRNHAAPRCDRAVNHLGAYADRALGTADAAKVEVHLESCDVCRERLAELRDLGLPLRRTMIVLPGALWLRGRDLVDAAGEAPATGARWAGAVGRRLLRLPRFRIRSPLAASTDVATSGVVQDVAGSDALQWLMTRASAGLLIVGVSVGPIVSGSDGARPVAEARQAVQPAGSPPARGLMQVGALASGAGEVARDSAGAGGASGSDPARPAAPGTWGVPAAGVAVPLAPLPLAPPPSPPPGAVPSAPPSAAAERPPQLGAVSISDPAPSAAPDIPSEVAPDAGTVSVTPLVLPQPPASPDADPPTPTLTVTVVPPAEPLPPVDPVAVVTEPIALAPPPMTVPAPDAPVVGVVTVTLPAVPPDGADPVPAVVSTVPTDAVTPLAVNLPTIPAGAPGDPLNVTIPIDSPGVGGGPVTFVLPTVPPDAVGTLTLSLTRTIDGVTQLIPVTLGPA